MAARRHRFVLLVQLLVVLTGIYQLSLLLRPENAFLSRPYIEDTFYAMGVARSVAHGNGISVDEVHPTNGVQPLICLLDVPFFLISGSDTELALRLCYGFSILLYLFAAWMVAGFARALYRGEKEEERRLVFWSVFGLIYVNYEISVYYLNGLETSLAGGMIFAALWYYVRWCRGGAENVEEGKTAVSEAGLSRYALLGVLLGVGVLARIDVSLLVVALLASHFIRAHLLYSRLPGRERWGRFLQATAQAFATGGAALLVSSPWWIYNYMTFGSLMPISGQSQQGLSQDMVPVLAETLNVLSDALLPGIHTPFQWKIGLWALYGLILFPIVLYLFSRLPGARRGLSLARSRFSTEWNLEGALPLGIFSLLLIGFYTLLFHAPHFQPRYLIVVTITMLLGLFAFFFTTWRLLEPETLLRKILPAALLLPLLLHFPFFARNFETTYDNIFVNVTFWIRDHVSAGEKVGMFQSGTTGFVHRDIVVNLDGKVNADAWEAYRNGRLPRYVDSLKFDYLIDWDSYMTRIFSDSGVRSRYRSVDTLPAGLIVWKRVDADSGREENR